MTTTAKKRASAAEKREAAEQKRMSAAAAAYLASGHGATLMHGDGQPRADCRYCVKDALFAKGAPREAPKKKAAKKAPRKTAAKKASKKPAAKPAQQTLASKRTARAAKRDATTEACDAVECPTCGAKPGQACTPLALASGKPEELVAGKVHKKRWRAYERAENEALRVLCPLCLSGEGAPCRDEFDRPRSPHNARLSAGERAGATTTAKKKTPARARIEAEAARAAPAKPSTPGLSPTLLDLARSVRCPLCKAAKGEPCSDSTTTHDARRCIEAALETSWGRACEECGAKPGAPCVGPGGALLDSFATMHARRRALSDEDLAALGVEPPHALGETAVACPTCGVAAGAQCVPVATSEGRRRPLAAGHAHTARQQAHQRALRVHDEPESAAPTPTPAEDPKATRAAKVAENAALPERSVVCPTCNAKVGAPCVRPSGHKTFGGEVHAPRRKAAEASHAAASDGSTSSAAEPLEPALRVECPTCLALPGEPCMRGKGKRKSPSPRPHEARTFAETGLDRACPGCGAGPYEHCKSDDGKRLIDSSKGKLVTHAARRPTAGDPICSVACTQCGAEPGAACRDSKPAGVAVDPNPIHVTVAGSAHIARLQALGLTRECPDCRVARYSYCRNGEGVELHAATGGKAVSHAGRRTVPLALPGADTCDDRDHKPDNAISRPPPAPKRKGEAREVRCPICGAAAGATCVQLGGAPARVSHHLRTAMAQRDAGIELSARSRDKLNRVRAPLTPQPPAPEQVKPAPVPAPVTCYECGHVECPITPDCSGCSSCAAERAANGTDDKVRKAEERARASGPLDGDVEVVELAIEKLRTDGGTQPRAAIHEPTVQQYASDYRDGARIPALRAVYDGANYWMWDGFHRRAALRLNGTATALVEVRQGTQRDAVLLSFGANAEHGLRRNEGDVKRAILRALADEEWSKKSLRWIAKHCRCRHSYVERVKKEFLDRCPPVDTSDGPQRVEGQDGKNYPATQPSRSPATATSRRTTVDYDGDAGPEEPSYEHERETGCEACGGFGYTDDAGETECTACGGDGVARAEPSPDVADDASNVDGERVEARAETPRIEAEPPLADRLNSTPAKPRKWRDILELPAGPIDPMLIIEHHHRLSLQVGLSDEERAELDRAKALGLSQWETLPDLADRMVELAGVAKMDRPSVLESSAGTGQLVEATRRACGRDAHITAHEIDPVRVQQLRKGAANVVLAGDFLAHQTPSRRYDASIDNTPYEGGLDGRFLERLMECSWRIVALCRLNVLTGKDRCERVWSKVKNGEWHLTDQVLLEQRPEFVGPGDDSARSDYVVVQLVHSSLSKCSKTKVDWW